MHVATSLWLCALHVSLQPASPNFVCFIRCSVCGAVSPCNPIRLTHTQPMSAGGGGDTTLGMCGLKPDFGQ
jgi:hypothetical protein